MIALTKAQPEWVHFGLGNIFKAFQCRVLQELLDNGTMNKGVIAVERKKKGEDSHEELVRLIKNIGYTGGLPVIVSPGILDPKEFIDTVVKVRLVNPFMPDMPQRIATDTSQKLPIRYGKTIKAYLAAGKVGELKYIPLVFTGWLRYLMAVDNEGRVFAPSPDPLLGYAQRFVKDFRLGMDISAEEILAKTAPLLSNEKIFDIDLVKIGMAGKVCDYFAELISKVGAVRAVLKRI